MDNVEEPTEEVHDDVEERLDDDRPHLHEPRAAEALLPHQHDVEVEEGEEGAKDCESCEHRDESDIEEILEGRAGEHLERLFIDLRHKPDYIVMSLDWCSVGRQLTTDGEKYKTRTKRKEQFAQHTNPSFGEICERKP